MKLYGFNNLTKSLSFNIYDVCYAKSPSEQLEYIAYIDSEYNSERLTKMMFKLTDMIGAHVLNVSKQDYEPQGASVTFLIADGSMKPAGGENLEEAAMDLGATPFYALRKVIIPQIKPGIISGLLIAFTMSIDDFVISFFTAGNGVSNLSIEIYSMTRRGIRPEINALSTIMFVVVLVLLILSNKSSKKEETI